MPLAAPGKIVGLLSVCLLSKRRGGRELIRVENGIIMYDLKISSLALF